MDDKLWGILSLARRAGALQAGHSNVLYNLKKRKGNLIIVALDAGKNTKKKYARLSRKYQIPCILWGEKQNYRTLFQREVAVLLVINEDFAYPFLLNEGGNLMKN